MQIIYKIMLINHVLILINPFIIYLNTQQQALNQQLLSQLNLGGNLPTNLGGANEAVQQTEDNASPQTSLVTVFVSGKNPGEFSKVVSTVTLSGDENNKRFKRSDED